AQCDRRAVMPPMFTRKIFHKRKGGYSSVCLPAKLCFVGNQFPNSRMGCASALEHSKRTIIITSFMSDTGKVDCGNPCPRILFAQLAVGVKQRMENLLRFGGFSFVQ